MAEEKKQEKQLYKFTDGDDFHSRCRKHYKHPKGDPAMLQALMGMDKNGNRIANGICYIYQSANLRI